MLSPCSRRGGERLVHWFIPDCFYTEHWYPDNTCKSVRKLSELPSGLTTSVLTQTNKNGKESGAQHLVSQRQTVSQEALRYVMCYEFNINVKTWVFNYKTYAPPKKHQIHLSSRVPYLILLRDQMWHPSTFFGWKESVFHWTMMTFGLGITSVRYCSSSFSKTVLDRTLMGWLYFQKRLQHDPKELHKSPGGKINVPSSCHENT